MKGSVTLQCVEEEGKSNILVVVATRQRNNTVPLMTAIRQGADSHSENKTDKPKPVLGVLYLTFSTYK